jgi:poly-gamma-glutamate synthesis protein (capsule biosynthesis protein)
MKTIHWLFLLCAALTLSACSLYTQLPLAQPTVTLVPTVVLTTRQPTATPTPPPTPTATPGPIQINLPPSLPADLSASLRQAIKPPADGRLVFADKAASADVVFTTTQSLSSTLVAEWVYAVAVPFPTFADVVTSTLISQFWNGQPDALSLITNNGSAPTLFVTTDTLRALTGFFGRAPAPGVPVQLVASDKLAEVVWAARPAAWAIVPFDQLDPRLKVLSLDGVSLLHRNGNNDYWLKIRVTLLPPKRGAETIQSFLKNKPLTNRDESRMTILAMTGVTALTRTTAWQMERKGVLYPALKIRDWLTSADVVHISNEVSFWEDCPPPATEGMIFCSAPKYTQIITDIHTSIVELTGNHLNDYGWEPLSYTLGIYNRLGIPYFGGGRTITEAQQAVTLTHNGNLLGFVGCNPVGPQIDWVNGMDDGRPGSAPCDDAVMQAEIKKLRTAGALPIATLQYFEFYDYPPTPQQIEDFRKLIDFGATIVSGSQGHHPQGFDLYSSGFIHYGVGNLFFGDQNLPGTHEMFVDRYLIYKNRLLSVELLTGFIEDYSQPRPMTPAERRAFLQTIFKASGW